MEAARLDAWEGSSFRLSALYPWFFGSSPGASALSCYRLLALIHAQDAELESALRISELTRDRTLGDRFAEQDFLRTAMPPGDRAELEALGERVQEFDERLALADDIIERVRLESERTLAVAERGRRERAVRERLHLAAPQSPPPTLDDLRAHLAGDTALISVVHSGAVWWALVITRDAPARFVRLDDRDLGRNAAAWVRRLRGEPVRAWPGPDGGLILDDLRPAQAVGSYLSTDELARRLGRLLMQPLAAAAGPCRRLVFVGDDELVGIPLQALPLGAGLALDRFAISYAPSLTTYARWQAAPGQRAFARDLLAVGVAEVARQSGPRADDATAAQLDFAADHPLPQARAEVAAIAALFAPSRRRSLLGAEARKAQLRAASRSGELAGYRYVHLATHAWADVDQPEASAVVLASSGEQAPPQAVLTAAELAGLHMGSDLVVLSACETGAGRFEHGRGLLGLAYAALAAGNRAALLTLWPIADDTTAAFMLRFYTRLRGTDPGRALAATQREFRASRDPRRADPAAWAPFVLYGAY